MPVFRTMVSVVELEVRKKPCAVQITENAKTNENKTSKGILALIQGSFLSPEDQTVFQLCNLKNWD